MSKRNSRRRTARRIGLVQALLVLVLLLAQGGRGGADQRLLPALGSIDGDTLGSVDTSEFVLDARPDRIHGIATRHGLTVVRSLDSHAHGVYLVRGPAGKTPAELIAEVEGDPEVAHVELNGLAITPEVPFGIRLDQSPVSILDALSDRSIIQYFGRPAWSRYVSQPATTVIRTADAHNTATGAGVVAIIDTGVDPNHPLLQGSLLDGYDFVNETAGQASEWTDLDPATAATLNQSPVSILDQSPVSILDSAAKVVSLNQSTIAVLGDSTAQTLDPATLPPAFGHGTMVAGLVHLVAPTAKIMPLKAFKADGSSRVFDIVRAIYYAVEHGARVINLSFSTTELSPEITHAINYATENGIICVSSAGNSGKQLLVYPAALRNVLGIGSTTSTSTPARSTFSNYGDSLVRLGAPGEAVITTYPGNHYVGAWGTSFSTALVSGAAALLVQKDPDIDPATASDYLGKADKMNHTGMGRGRLNAYDAVRQLPDDTAPTVTFVAPSAGAAVRKTVAVSVSASDNISIASVRFLIGDEPLGADDTAAPFEVMWNTSALGNGSYTLSAIARDGAGNATRTSIGVTVANDTAAPTITLTSPAGGAHVSGAISVKAEASDDGELTGVQFLVDGTPLGALDTAAPYEVSWSTATASNGPHVLTAVARDSAGNEATSAIVSVTVANDTKAPTVAITSPATDATLMGALTLTASASDDVAVASVQFMVDGMPLGTPAVVAPYAVTWSTHAVPNGTHAVTAVARDAAGNETTSASVTVTVANDTTAPTVTVTSPGTGAWLAGSIPVTANATDDVGVVSVQFLVDGVPVGAADVTAPYRAIWSTTTNANGAHTVSAVARDAAGNEARSASVTVTVANDTTPPAVAVTGPAPGVTVSGTVTLAATATDDYSVASVQFLVDGVALGAADVAAPYGATWSTLTVVNGAHTLTAIARDAAGNQATSSSVTVIVSNDATAPTVAVTSPAAGATVGGTVMLTASATDDFSVVSVQFFVDGTPLGPPALAGPYQAAWSTTSVSNGSHTLTAVARDGAGNEASSPPIILTVYNEPPPQP